MGLIFDIQRFCIHDGPGIRTTVFLKGCPLRCSWCSNPESQAPLPEFLFSPDLCMGCGACGRVCPLHAPYSSSAFQADACLHCGKCTADCPTEALTAKGENLSVSDLLERLCRDRAVYDSSGGGVTFSGGEPLLQIDFLTQALAACKDSGLSTCIESTLFAPWEHIARCLPLLDYILCDVKHTDAAVHSAWTGVSCRPILENIRRLAESDRTVVFRIPVIPGFNTTPEAQQGFLALFASMPPHPIELLPYHIYGERKYQLLRRSYSGADIPAHQARPEAETLCSLLQSAGHNVSISG